MPTKVPSRATTLAIALCALVLASCSPRARQPEQKVAKGTESWIQTSASDSFGWDSTAHAATSAEPTPRRSSSAEIDVQGDSMVVEVADADGRLVRWNSWSGELPGATLPGFKFDEEILISQVAPGETAPYVSFSLQPPAPAPYSIRIEARNRSTIFLHVTRRESTSRSNENNQLRVWTDKTGAQCGSGHGYAGAGDEPLLERNAVMTWVAELSPVGQDSCWVRLSRSH